MLLRQMKYMVAIVDSGSFTEAAERMFISQSAISQQMKVLEQELGVQLFVRAKRSFTLTPAGEYFYAQARSVLGTVEQMRIKTMELGAEDSHEARLRVGYLSNYSGRELYEAVEKFSEVYPNIPIDITSGTHEELYHGMINGSLDMAFNDQRRAFSDDFINDEMMKCDCFIEVSARHPLSKQAFVELADLTSMIGILIASKDQQATEADYYRNILGYDIPFLFAESMEEGRLMMVANRGFLPVESIGTMQHVNPSVVRLRVLKKGKPLQRKYCVFWLKDHENYYIAEFANILHQLFTKH